MSPEPASSHTESGLYEALPQKEEKESAIDSYRITLAPYKGDQPVHLGLPIFPKHGIFHLTSG